MTGDWRLLSIEAVKAKTRTAISIGPFGSRMKSDRYVAAGVPVIRGNNISDTRELIGELVHVSEETADELRTSNVYPDDLFFPHRGAIGQVGIVPRGREGRYVLSTSLMKLTCDTFLVDPLFVFYFFRSAAGRHQLLKNASTVGTPGIGQPLASLRSIRLPVPPLTVQRAVARILSLLDDKIELNRRMNETLEAMARALFKSWFVDFDPVRAKAEGRQPAGMDAETAALFPSEFEESALGEIPRGWRVSTGGPRRLRGEPIEPSERVDELFDHYDGMPAYDEAGRAVSERGTRDGEPDERSIAPGLCLLDDGTLIPRVRTAARWSSSVGRRLHAVPRNQCRRSAARTRREWFWPTSAPLTFLSGLSECWPLERPHDAISRVRLARGLARCIPDRRASSPSHKRYDQRCRPARTPRGL